MPDGGDNSGLALLESITVHARDGRRPTKQAVQAIVRADPDLQVISSVAKNKEDLSTAMAFVRWLEISNGTHLDFMVKAFPPIRIMAFTTLRP